MKGLSSSILVAIMSMATAAFAEEPSGVDAGDVTPHKIIDTDDAMTPRGGGGGGGGVTDVRRVGESNGSTSDRAPPTDPRTHAPPAKPTDQFSNPFDPNKVRTPRNPDVNRH